MTDSLIRAAIKKQVDGERFVTPGVGQVELGLTSIELHKRALTNGLIRRGGYRLANRLLAAAACLAIALLLAAPVAARDFGRPLARSITAAWSEECAESLVSFFIGG